MLFTQHVVIQPTQVLTNGTKQCESQQQFLTSIQGAFFWAHSSMARRIVPLGVNATGRASLWPVAGHLRLPCCSHRSI